MTAAAVLAENSAWTGEGVNGGAGKTVDGLGDAASVGTNIASVIDSANNTYVLSIDGKRMAITRFTPTGQLDSGITGWTTSGTYVLPDFTGVNNQDTPKAMAIDTTRNYLFVAGGSNSQWAMARVNINTIRTTPMGWIATMFTGTANAIRFDSTDADSLDPKIGVAGTTSSSQIQVAVLHAMDNLDPPNPPITGGTLATADFASPNGYATASNSIYGVAVGWAVTASASALVEGDDVFGFNGRNDEEYYVSGTVNYCCGASSGSDMVVIDFLKEGTPNTSFGNGSGAALFNTCSPSSVMGTGNDSNYALIGSIVGSTKYLTLLGGTGSVSSVLSERFTANDGQKDTAAYGPLDGGGPLRKGFATGPAGVAYAAILDPDLNQIVASGSGGSNDFLALRLNNDGTLDTTFGQSGSIKIDFGTTSGITTDGGRTIVMRTLADGSTDILVGGYTYDAGTQKYKIALVDLLDDNMFHVT